MIAILTAETWGKAPSEYLFGDPLILSIDYECAKILSQHKKKQLQDEADKNEGEAV